MTASALPGRKPALADFCLAAFSLTVVVMTVLPFFILCRYNHPGDNDNWWIFRTFLDRYSYDLSPGGFFSFRGGINFANIFFIPLYRHPEGMTESLFRTFISIYHLSAAFYVGLFWLSASVLFIALNRALFRFRGCRAFFFYALFIYLAFNSVHYPTMAFYDLVSSSGYNAGLSYLFLFLSFALLGRTSSGRSRLLYGLPCVLFFCLCAFSMEYYPFICGCFSFAFILYDLVKARRLNVLHTLFLAVCLLAFARNFLLVRGEITPNSDGNVGKYTDGEDPGYTLAITFGTMLGSLKESFLRYFHQLVTQRRYLPAMATLSIGAALAMHRRALRLPVWAVLPFFLVILGTAAVFSFATPDVFVMPRYAWTLFVLIFLFVGSLLVSLVNSLAFAFDRARAADSEGDFSLVQSGVAAAVRIFRRWMARRPLLIAFTVAGTLLFCFFALKNAKSPVATAWKDLLKGEAAAYDQESSVRYEAIFSAGEGEPVYLVPILHRPASLFVRDSMEFEVGRITYRRFFDNDNIYFKVGDLIIR